MNINGYVPFCMNTLDSLVRGTPRFIIAAVNEQWLPSSRRRQVLYFANVIKISIFFSTSLDYFFFSNLLLGYNDLTSTHRVRKI